MWLPPAGAPVGVDCFEQDQVQRTLPLPEGAVTEARLAAMAPG